MLIRIQLENGNRTIINKKEYHVAKQDNAYVVPSTLHLFLHYQLHMGDVNRVLF